MMCPANDMIQDFPKRFKEYKRTVHKLVYIERIQKAQELWKEDKSKAQALPMLEFEDFNYEQLKEIAEHRVKSSSPATEYQVTPTSYSQTCQ